jgi:hypothetical protein
MFDAHDRNRLRELARQVADTAALPVMSERRRRWVAHNALRRGPPMLLVFPEGAWGELLPATAFRCHDERARNVEWQLRARLYYHHHFPDDTVVEREWNVGPALQISGWGLEPRQHPRPSDAPRGAWSFDPVIREPADLKKLRRPQVTHDAAATAQAVAEARELFGDLLDVKARGVTHISFHLMAIYTRLRGLAEVMLDMYENPQMLHDAMAFLEDGHRQLLRQYQELNLLDLNNDSTYHSSGGNGYTDELPAAGATPGRVRPCDMWSSAEAQEMAQVSPDMHREFILQYEKRLLAPFGLNGYGCCEDLTHKLDDVLTIPRLRRVSISPWADVEACARRLERRAIFSWKPNPAMLCGTFDPAAVRTCIRRTICACREHDCALEIILKDTHTCENHPERFDQWLRIAREEIDAAAGGGAS